jgi:hypothetical protein
MKGKIPWYRFTQPSLTKQSLITPEEIEKLIGTGGLYNGEHQLPGNKIFADPLWHPGKTDTENHWCFIYAINLYVGGALYDTAEKFAQLYGERVKRAQKSYYHDLALKGVSFLNLKWIFYNPGTN